MRLASIDDVRLFSLPSMQDDLGKLIIAEAGSGWIPFDIRRVFVVSGAPEVVRGKHAHKMLTQIFICISGKCDIIYDDGNQSKQVVLDASEKALQVPPGIWAEQRYIGSESTLMVLCDYLYDESDYIRNYNDFLAYRKEASI